MSSYWDMGIKPVPFIADEDLTSTQWKLVSPASTGGYVIATVSACNPIPVGVLVNDPSAGQAAEVVILGPTKAYCRVTGCDLKNGRLLQAASDGYLEPIDVAGACLVFARYFDALKITADSTVVANVLIMGVSGSSQTHGTS